MISIENISRTKIAEKEEKEFNLSYKFFQYNSLKTKIRHFGAKIHINKNNSKSKIIEKKDKISFTTDEDAISEAVKLAKTKGWTKVKIKGFARERQKIWLEANKQGIETIGYKPNKSDIRELSAYREEQQLDNQTRATNDDIEIKPNEKEIKNNKQDKYKDNISYEKEIIDTANGIFDKSIIKSKQYSPAEKLELKEEFSKELNRSILDIKKNKNEKLLLAKITKNETALVEKIVRNELKRDIQAQKSKQKQKKPTRKIKSTTRER